MTRSAVTVLVLALLVLAGYMAFERHADLQRQKATAQRVERLASAVERLASNVELLLTERAIMADVPIVHGDTSLGRPQELTWKSGGDTIKLTVYKATANETAAEWTARLQAYISEYQAAGQYPPDA